MASAGCLEGVADKLARWMDMSKKWAGQAADEEVARHHAAASMHYFVAAQASQHASEIMYCLATDEPERAAARVQQDLALQYTKKGESNSKAACDERERLIQASGEEEGTEAQSAELRASIEKRFVKGSKECAGAWFDLIIGQETTKQDIREGFLYPLLYPNLYPSRSKSLLLYGPPGTGKTLMAKAIANELSVQSGGRVRLLLFAPRPAEILSKYVGEAQKQIRDLFKYASEWAKQEQDRCGAEQVLSVIFLDEVEAIAGDRASDKTGFMSSTLNPLLQEMDGVDSADNVVVIAATNYPWQLDAAFLRRFTSRVLVDLPTEADIKRYIESKVSRITARFTGSPFARPAAAAAAPDPCRLCDASDREAAIARSQHDAYTKVVGDLGGETIPLVTVTDRLGLFSERLHNALFSLSDVDALFDKVTKYAGTQAQKDGKFVRFDGASMPFGPPQQVYVSETTFEKRPSDVLGTATKANRMVLAQEGGEMGEIPVLRVSGNEYISRELHTAIVPEDWGPLVSKVWVRYVDDVDPPEARALELMLATSFAGEVRDPHLEVSVAVDTALFEAAMAEQQVTEYSAVDAPEDADDEAFETMRVAYVLKQLPNANDVKVEDARAVAANSNLHTAHFLREFAEYGYTGVTRSEDVLIRLRFKPTPMVTASGFFYGSTTTTTYSTLAQLGSGTALLEALLRKQPEGKVDVYTQWGTTGADAFQFKRNSADVLRMLKTPSTIPNAFDVRSIAAFAADTVPARLRDAYVPVGSTTFQIDVRFVPVDAVDPKTGYSNIRLLRKKTDGWNRLVSWNFSDEAFLEARKKTQPSADVELIALVREYAKNPDKVAGCMLKRPEINEECAALVRAERDRLKSKPTSFEAE